MTVQELKKRLFSYVNKRVKASDEELEYYWNQFEFQSYQKNEILLNKEQICRYIRYVTKGALYTYYLNADGIEAINGIAIENNFCTALPSYITQTSSSEFIKALEDTNVLAISHKNFSMMIDKHPVFNELYKIILEEYQLFVNWRMESFMNLSAKDRLLLLNNKFPKLQHRLPNKVMAAYLGITPETLSRIKHE